MKENGINRHLCCGSFVVTPDCCPAFYNYIQVICATPKNCFCPSQDRGVRHRPHYQGVTFLVVHWTLHYTGNTCHYTLTKQSKHIRWHKSLEYLNCTIVHLLLFLPRPFLSNYMPWFATHTHLDWLMWRNISFQWPVFTVSSSVKLAPNTQQTWWRCSGKNFVFIAYYNSCFTWHINKYKDWYIVWSPHFWHKYKRRLSEAASCKLPHLKLRVRQVRTGTSIDSIAVCLKKRERKKTTDMWEKASRRKGASSIMTCVI